MKREEINIQRLEKTAESYRKMAMYAKNAEARKYHMNNLTEIMKELREAMEAMDK